jgi:signal transduction histidine kinase
MRSSLGWPIALGVTMIVLIITLIVFWLLTTFVLTDRPATSIALMVIGTLFLVLVLVGVVLYLWLSIKEIRLNRRQSNFIASVTHELKSPIASLKLYLQTLSRRSVPEDKQAEFFQFMLADVERLNGLINHMLDAARLDQQPTESEAKNVALEPVLRSCAETARLRYHLPAETVRISAAPVVIRSRPIDLEMVFRNLIDNAIKYGGEPPQVEIDAHPNGNGGVVVRVTDNGRGIPDKLRRKIFGRFVRLGSELERTATGTGLGLFIVRTLVKRLKGTIVVRGRGNQPGTVFEVQLPILPDSSAADMIPATVVPSG